MVKEAAKIRLTLTPGKSNNNFEGVSLQDLITPVQAAGAVDDNYMVVGAHIDAGLKQRIVNHEYMDSAHLLPKDRISQEEDHGMKLVNKGGFTYFAPVSDRENAGSITSFSRWEQAFRVFSNVYTKYYPNRATELIQYNHIIYSASQSFIWDNVYSYDKEFRMHLSNYPHRS